MTNDNEQDFEIVAVTRDLARRPEVKFLATVLQKINSTEPVATPAPIYVMLAFKIINHKGAMDNLKQALEIVTK